MVHLLFRQKLREPPFGALLLEARTDWKRAFRQQFGVVSDVVDFVGVNRRIHDRLDPGDSEAAVYERFNQCPDFVGAAYERAGP